MATKRSAQTLLYKYLGKEAADAIFRKVDRMVREGASVAAIEKLIAAELMVHIEAQVIKAAFVRTRVANRPVQVAIKAKTAPIKISPKITPAIQTRIGPGISAKGAR